MNRGSQPVRRGASVIPTNTITNEEDAMAFQAVPDGVEVVMHAVQNGVPIVNVYNFKSGAAISDALLQTAAETLYYWWHTDMRANQHTSYIVNDVTATDISVEGGHQYVHTPSSDNAGTSSSEPMSGQAAAVVSWRTPRIGRSYRGRTYLGGGQVGWTVNAQYLDTAFTAGLASIMDSLITVMESVSLTLSVLSRVLNGAQRVVGVLTAVTTFIIDTVVDTQRRRAAN